MQSHRMLRQCTRQSPQHLHPLPLPLDIPRLPMHTLQSQPLSQPLGDHTRLRLHRNIPIIIPHLLMSPTIRLLRVNRTSLPLPHRHRCQPTTAPSIHPTQTPTTMPHFLQSHCHAILTLVIHRSADVVSRENRLAGLSLSLSLSLPSTCVC